MTDYEAAKAQAKKEGKDLLISFTGSDWCGPCIRLKKEVFVHDAFKNGVKDQFVLVEVDFPRNKEKLKPETHEQNKKLGKSYGVRGYPTILLTDAEGRPYHKTGYRPGGAEPYLKGLDALRAAKTKRDESFAAAEKAEGVDKAKALAAGLGAISVTEAQLENFYGPVVEQIKAADPEDASGYLKDREQAKRIGEFRNKLNGFARKRDMAGALVLVDQTLAEGGFDLEQTQKLIMTKAMIYANMKNHDEALASIKRALAANPDGENNEAIIRMRAQIEAAKAKAEAPAPEAPKEKAPDEPAAPDIKEGVKEPVRARDK